MRVGFYAGSFDPITRGHLDVIRQALTVFDELHVAVGRNPAKTGLFSPVARMAMIDEACQAQFGADRARIHPVAFEGGLAKAARHHGATHLVRAFRQASDFNDEFGLHGALERIAPDLPIVYLICPTEFLHVSSSMARQLAALGEDVSWLVPPCVETRLKDVSPPPMTPPVIRP